jgi:hypothetical protein
MNKGDQPDIAARLFDFAPLGGQQCGSTGNLNQPQPSNHR